MKKISTAFGELLIICMIFSISFFVTSANAADWPNFRNNASNTGVSSETINLPLTEQWHSSAPDVEENGVVVARGVAYITTDNGRLYAFNVATGFEVPGFPVSVPRSWSTPAVDVANSKIYVLTSGSLYAFNLDGTTAWTRGVGSTGTNYSQGPVVDEGYVYFKAGGMLQKYDAAGTAIWAMVAGGNNTQPAVMGDFVYVNSEGGAILKFNKLTGAPAGAGFPISTGVQQASLAVANDKIFFKADQLYVYNANTGASLWTQPVGGNATYYNSPAVAGGAVYVYGWDARLYAFDENTGATLPGFPSAPLSAPNDRNWSSPAVAGNKVFVGAGTTQRLKILGAAGTAQAGLVLEEHLTFSTDPQGFDLCSPAVSDGYVFAMLDGGGLYAFFGGEGEPPTGALSINGGDDCTDNQLVTLTLDNNSNPNVVDMRISENPLFTGVPWQPYQPSSSFMLSAGFGTKTVYAQLRDNLGQLSNVFTDQIDYQATCQQVLICDVDVNGQVDINDINAIAALRNTPASGPDDPADADGNGIINANDARQCVLQCTNARCAP